MAAAHVIILFGPLFPCQTLPGLPRAARPSGRFAEGKTPRAQMTEGREDQELEVEMGAQYRLSVSTVNSALIQLVVCSFASLT